MVVLQRALRRRGALLTIVSLAVGAVSAAIVFPTFNRMPIPWFEEDTPAIIRPSPFSMHFIFPWLLDMDRRLLAFGWLTVCCKLLALVLFPALLASERERERRAAASSSVGRSSRRRVLTGRAIAIWRRWAAASVVVLLVGGAANLLAIRWGFAPAFPAYTYSFNFQQNLAMILPALLVLPVYGLMVTILSIAGGWVVHHPGSAVPAAYGMALLAECFIGAVIADVQMSVAEFVPPPGLETWSTAAILINWLIYSLLCSAIALVVWYFVSLPATKSGRSSHGVHSSDSN